MKKKFLLLILVMICPAFSAAAQNTKPTLIPRAPTPEVSAPPGNIKLLEGYTNIKKRGVDSSVGEISKPDGLKISYDIGRMAGNRTKGCKIAGGCILKSQKLNDQDIIIALSKNGSLVAFFPSANANFFAITKSTEEIADFFLMILTYIPKNKR